MWPKYGLKSGKPSKMWVFLYEVFFAEIVFLFFLLKGMDHLFEFSARETRKRFSPENSKHKLQCNLDLVTLNLVTICDLVTILQSLFVFQFTT